MSEVNSFNINKNNVSQKERVLELAKRDLVSFGQLFLPGDYMKSSPAAYHYELSNLLLDSKKKRNCIILPRGHSKSTLAKTALLYHLYFNPEGKNEFIAWVAEEQSQAIDHIKYMQNHIEINPALNYYFGDLRGSKWTEKEFTTSKGDRVIAKGTSQRLRGRSQLGLRYTKIVLDDFESELNTKTPDRRREIKEWVMSTVEPALENSAGNEGSIWLIGTIVHYDSFLQSIYDGYTEATRDKRRYAWDVMYHKAIDGDGNVLWSSYFSKQKLADIRRRFEDVGLAHKFAQEYLNEARDLENAKFKTDRLEYYDHEFESKNNYAYLVNSKEAIPVNIYIGVDLAYESKASSDYQMIMVIGIDSDRNIYVVDYMREHIPLYDMPEKIFEYAKEYSPVKRVNVEHVGAQGIIKDAVNRMTGQDRKVAPGVALGVRPPTGIKKEDRLESLLAPLVNRGKMFIKRKHTALIDEMFQFPKGKNDDVLDGLWYAINKSRPPISKKFEANEFQADNTPKNKIETVKRTISWITGQKS
jgi:phage terminase large subunit-like protein|tara:strand:- start:7165 stop:8748 length:1584 start_codon:yes stop_codon:yes gene_type:complete